MPIPTNKALYERVKREAKKRFKVWPSAYASGWLVKTYKQRGGKYKNGSRTKTRKSKTRKTRKSKKSRKVSNLSRWYREKWIDTCKLPRKVSCGRKKSTKKGYPYCRPSVRVSPQTPKTVREIGKEELKRRCSRKRKNPYSRLKSK